MSGSFADTPSEVAEVSRVLATTQGVAPTLCAVVTKAVALLPCRWAAIAVADHLTARRARLSAATDEALASTIASIAGRAGTSPGITAFESGKVVVCSDLTSTDEYPRYSADMLAQTPVRSVLSVPISTGTSSLGVLTCYADHADAFDHRAVEAAEVLAGLAVLAIEAALGEDRAENLEIALLRSRTIGAAIGILMERKQLSSAQAFEWLTQLSQDSNRKLAEVAVELVETGRFDDLPRDRAV